MDAINLHKKRGGDIITRQEILLIRQLKRMIVFTATWCDPYKAIAPHVHQLSEK